MVPSDIRITYMQLVPPQLLALATNEETWSAVGQSYCIENMLLGVWPETVYSFMDRVIAGHRVVNAIKQLYDNAILLTGCVFYTDLNGLTWQNWPATLQQQFNTALVPVNRIEPTSSAEALLEILPRLHA